MVLSIREHKMRPILCLVVENSLSFNIYLIFSIYSDDTCYPIVEVTVPYVAMP